MLLLVGKGATMEKWMSIGSMVVAAIMFLVFMADLVAGVPFSGDYPDSPFMLVDIGGIIGSLVVGYLGYNAYRDAK